MANQIKKTQDIIRENGKILKDIKKQWIITEEQQKKLAEVMSSDEIVDYVSQKKKKTQDAIKQTRDDWKKTEWFQTTVKTRKEDIALIKQVAEKMDVSFEEAYNMLHGGDELKKKTSEKKESKETSINLPLDVALQEKKAIRYFEAYNEPNNLKVIEQVKKMRESRKITYEDLWWWKYAVIMPCGNKKLKMEFPADMKLADNTYNYIDFDGKEITKKQTTRWKLWSKKWKEYLEQKEKEWQKLLSESEFKTLISSLLPDGNQKEQILAFMIATWFYGWMWLADKTWDFQHAVSCCRTSGDRCFHDVFNDLYNYSLIYHSFVG